jgi:microcystin-dependent protein
MDYSIPVGTITAYAGPFSTDTIANLKQLGWLPCDGSSYKKKDYADLALSILDNFGGTGGFSGSFNVPDFRGRFVRGTDHGTGHDPDAKSRTSSNPGGDTGDNVGSLQPFATGKPNIPFATSTDGLHSHNVPHAPVNNNAYAIAGSHYGLWNGGSVSTDSAGDHTHTVNSGFDLESRPINTYVNFIIKFQDQ